MVKLSAYGTIKDGKLTLSNRKRFNADLKEFKDCAVELTVKKKGRRSLPQNNFYWAVVVQEVKLGLLEIGYRMTDEEVHYFLKQKFNPIELPSVDGEVIEVPGSTTDLNKSQFSEYVERIAQWSSEYLNVVLPMPGEKMSLNF